MGKLIVITGNTGVGKTSLAHALAKNGDFTLALEEHDTRPFQTLCKSDKRYAFANQVDYLLFRGEQERTLRQLPQTGLVDGGLDQDFHGFTRLFHTNGLLTDAEFEICHRLYVFFRAQLPPPDLIIHLEASQIAISNRLAMRTRINIADEQDLTLLDSLLNEWLATIPSERVLRLNVSNSSAQYLEILPILKKQISARLGQSPEYDTGYIP